MARTPPEHDGPSFAGRAKILDARRNLKMAQSAHAYVRGSTAQFYQWLEASEGKIPDGPPVWICGDCHVGNLGPLADARGKVAIQIRDVDQTVIGNPAHDLIRLGLSLASAVRGSDLPGVTTARMIEAMMAGYEQALASDYTDGPPRTKKSVTVKAILRQSMRRRWRHLAHERLRDARPSIPLGDRFWAPTARERGALAELFGGDAMRGMLTQLQGREARDEIELLDAAYWVKGCSSLGRLRYAALLRVGGHDMTLVDVKEATLAAAPRAQGVKMPKDDAERVVAGARALSPHLGERMIAARLLDRPVIIRELMPQDLKIAIERLGQEEAMAIANYLANVVGRAHGRQMSLTDRSAWLAQLGRGRPDALEAPPWLWRSVVELLSIHEAEYLDHCRRYALAAA